MPNLNIMKIENILTKNTEADHSPKPLSDHELDLSRNGLMSSFPMPDIYEPEDTIKETKRED